MYVPLAILGVIIPGVGLFLWTRQSNDEDAKVDLPEWIGGTVVLIVLVLLLTSFCSRLGVDSKIDGYREFWNGSIIAAKTSTTPCGRDGNCNHDYRCDPYEVPVEHTTYDSKGNVSGSYTTYETHYHHCPYVTEEHSFWLEDSFGQRHSIADGIFTATPVSWRPSDGEGIPSEVERGIPPLWQQVYNQVAAGDAPPATKTNSYSNFILAADQTLLKQYSPDIATYLKKNLLPPHTTDWRSDPLHGGWTAQKFQAVGGVRVNTAKWNDALGHFNSALGTTLQGDLHMVVIPASKVSNSEAYINALTAYWQSPVFGKRSLAKNGIVVVLGISPGGTKVEWARAKTGMPIGNGEMISAVEGIKDLSFTPDAVLGNTKASVNGGKLQFHYNNGVLQRVILQDSGTKFQRPCMQCKDKTDHGSSYVYLKSDVSVPGWVGPTVFIVSLILSAMLWTVLYIYPVVSTVKETIIG